MLLKFKYTIFIQAILLSSCINKQEILDNHIENLKDERVKTFNITECLTDCYQDSGRLIKQSLDSNILKLELGHWMNCATSINNSIWGFDFNNGILNLLVKYIPEGVDIKINGDTSFTYGGAEACDCYFIFKFELTGFEEIPDSILINNKPINNYLGLMDNLYIIGSEPKDSTN